MKKIYSNLFIFFVIAMSSATLAHSSGARASYGIGEFETRQLCESHVRRIFTAADIDPTTTLENSDRLLSAAFIEACTGSDEFRKWTGDLVAYIRSDEFQKTERQKFEIRMRVRFAVEDYARAGKEIGCDSNYDFKFRKS